MVQANIPEGEPFVSVVEILRRLATADDAESGWAAVAPALEHLSLDELVELDQRLYLTADDLREGASGLKRRVVVRILQRKLASFLYDCFDPFVNPWVLQSRMQTLFWRIEFVRSLAEQLEEVAEAHKFDADLPWTVTGNLFGMANAALLAANLGGWDDTVSGYGQGEPPHPLSFRGEGRVLATRPS